MLAGAVHTPPWTSWIPAQPRLELRKQPQYHNQKCNHETNDAVHLFCFTDSQTLRDEKTETDPQQHRRSFLLNVLSLLSSFCFVLWSVKLVKELLLKDYCVTSFQINIGYHPLLNSEFITLTLGQNGICSLQQLGRARVHSALTTESGQNVHVTAERCAATQTQRNMKQTPSQLEALWVFNHAEKQCVS